MPLHVLGINHHSAPLEVREKLAFPPETQADALTSLAARPGVAEAVLVSTCNRTEIYCRGRRRRRRCARGSKEEAAKSGLDIESHLYSHREARGRPPRLPRRLGPRFDGAGRAADPRPGEAVGAHGASTAARWARLLDRLFQQTFSVAKEVRTQTAIGAQSISMSAAALKLAQNLFGDISRTKMLLIGVGEMVELAATYFVAQGPQSRGRGQPHARARGGLRRALQRHRDRARAASRAAARVRHRDHRHRLHAAHPRQGRLRARAQGAPLPPDVRRRLRRAARRRARRGRAARTSSSTPSTTWARSSRKAPGSAQAAVAEAEAIIDRQVEAFSAWLGARGRGAGHRRSCAPGPTSIAQTELAKAKSRLAQGRGPGQRCSRPSPSGLVEQVPAPPDAGPEPRRGGRARIARARRRDPLPRQRRRPGRAGGAMKPAIAAKLASLVSRAEGARRAPLRPRASPTNLDNYRKLSREHAEIAPVVGRYGEYVAAQGDVAAAEDMAKDPADARVRRGRDQGRPRAARGDRRRHPEDAAAEGSQRREEPLPRDPRRHRRRRERALRGRPLPHVRALRREEPLAGRGRLREPRRRRRLQGGHRAHRRARAPTRGSSSSPAATACSACPPPRRRAASTPRPPRSP